LITKELLRSLKPEIQDKVSALLDFCQQSALEILIYCTFRSFENQAKLYCQGRTVDQIAVKAIELANIYHRDDLSQLLLATKPQPGAIVTFAAPGQSLHNYGLAFDAVPVANGKLIWGNTSPEERKLWQLYGKLGRKAGLDWAGNWRKFREYPHLQMPNADWRELIVVGEE